MFQGPKSILPKLKLTGPLDLGEGSISVLPVQTTIAAATKTFVSGDCGKWWTYSYAGTGTLTLPANTQAKKGRFLIITNLVDQTLSIAAATADTLITNGDLQADSVSFETSSHKIGGTVLIFGTGSYWCAVNLSDCTMTVTTA